MREPVAVIGYRSSWVSLPAARVTSILALRLFVVPLKTIVLFLIAIMMIIYAH